MRHSTAFWRMYRGTRDIPRLRSRFLCRIIFTKISTAFCQAKNKAYRDCSAKSRCALFYFRTNGSIRKMIKMPSLRLCGESLGRRKSVCSGIVAVILPQGAAIAVANQKNGAKVFLKLQFAVIQEFGLQVISKTGSRRPKA